MELPPARRAGLRRADDELFGLDRLRRGLSRKRSRAIRCKGPADEINQAADEAIKRYPFIDASRQAAGGASYGGHLTNWLAVSTDRYRALVSHAGLYDLKTQWTTSDIAYSRERGLGGPPWEGKAVWKEQSPFWQTKKLKTPILLSFGERDFRGTVQQRPRVLHLLLQRQRVESRLVIFPEENHWVLKARTAGTSTRKSGLARQALPSRRNRPRGLSPSSASPSRTQETVSLKGTVPSLTRWRLTAESESRPCRPSL